MSLVCDMETVICGIRLVNYCFQFSDMLKRVLNLVSLESDFSVSEAYISQLLGQLDPLILLAAHPWSAQFTFQHPGPAVVQVRNVGCCTYMGSAPCFMYCVLLLQ